MSDNGRYDKTFRDKPILNYILHEVPQGAFKAQFEPLSKRLDFKEAASRGKDDDSGEITEAKQAAIDSLKPALQKVLPLPVNTKDDVEEAVFAICSRIMQNFSHRPGIDF